MTYSLLVQVAHFVVRIFVDWGVVIGWSYVGQIGDNVLLEVIPQLPCQLHGLGFGTVQLYAEKVQRNRHRIPYIVQGR